MNCVVKISWNKSIVSISFPATSFIIFKKKMVIGKKFESEILESWKDKDCNCAKNKN
jgi:hypothetical protein